MEIKNNKVDPRLKEKAERIVERLKEIYPESRCALEYNGEPWKLLVMSRLSAQCTDKRVNEVSLTLFEKYPTPEALAEGELSDIENIVRPCGLYKVKASDIKKECQKLVYEYGGALPCDMDKLLEFPGVGRKIANLLVGDIFGKPAIVADTHCIRISSRLGLVSPPSKNPLVVEKTLRELVNEKEGSDFCHRIVFFGREVCSARKPMCSTCPLSDLCDKVM
ncbi:MAG: endonuclease III [Ruminococcaceae bacterium]|nr:endonuclease III [Oscillospiraceae bacterium]